MFINGAIQKRSFPFFHIIYLFALKLKSQAKKEENRTLRAHFVFAIQFIYIHFHYFLLFLNILYLSISNVPGGGGRFKSLLKLLKFLNSRETTF